MHPARNCLNLMSPLCLVLLRIRLEYAMLENEFHRTPKAKLVVIEQEVSNKALRQIKVQRKFFLAPTIACWPIPCGWCIHWEPGFKANLISKKPFLFINN